MKTVLAFAFLLAPSAVAEEKLPADLGIYAAVGGGVADFTESNVEDATQFGGYWDARVGVGSKTIFAGEVAYSGGARDIAALGLNDAAYLMNNGVEGIARLNVPLDLGTDVQELRIAPYTFGGVGWQHYNLGNVTTNTSSVQFADDIMTVPLGLGLAFAFEGITLDGRLTYRHAFFSDMLGTATSSFDSTSLSSWTAGAALGFEF